MESDPCGAGTPTVKLTLVGPDGVGKTSLIISYTTNTYKTGDDVPYIMDQITSNVRIGDQLVVPYIWDTAGKEDYDRLRPLSYPQTNAVILCFSLIDRKSLTQIKEKFAPEVAYHLPGVRILLVGTKFDLTQDEETLKRLADEESSPVSEDEMQRFAKEIGATSSIMCSARTMHQVKEAFETAIRLTAIHEGKK